jgi:hypothetical protein
MTCEHADCHCQSEVGIEREGRNYCSQSCAQAAAGDRRRAALPPAGDAGSRRRQENCACGHVGCSGADELRASA